MGQMRGMRWVRVNKTHSWTSTTTRGNHFYYNQGQPFLDNHFDDASQDGLQWNPQLGGVTGTPYAMRDLFAEPPRQAAVKRLRRSFTSLRRLRRDDGSSARRFSSMFFCCAKAAVGRIAQQKDMVAKGHRRAERSSRAKRPRSG